MVRLQLLSVEIVLLCVLSFNPTMVRLQPIVAAIALGSVIAFNPTMVRLQLQPNRHDRGLWQRFQSHYGAIATVC